MKAIFAHRLRVVAAPMCLGEDDGIRMTRQTNEPGIPLPARAMGTDWLQSMSHGSGPVCVRLPEPC